MPVRWLCVLLVIVGSGCARSRAIPPAAISPSHETSPELEWPKAARVETEGGTQIGYYEDGGRAWECVRGGDGRLGLARAWYPGGGLKAEIEYRDGAWHRTRLWRPDGSLSQDVLNSKWWYP
jgi:hypothetical protein